MLYYFLLDFFNVFILLLLNYYFLQVGSAFSRAKALQELSLIASDPDESHLFRVTNYSALNVLLSALQQKIIGLEGKEGEKSSWQGKDET